MLPRCDRQSPRRTAAFHKICFLTTLAYTLSFTISFTGHTRAVFASEQDNRENTAKDRDKTKQIKAKMDKRRQYLAGLKHPKINIRLNELVDIYTNQGPAAAVQFAHKNGLSVQNGNEVNIRLGLYGSRKITSLIVKLSKVYPGQFQKMYGNTIDGYIPIHQLRSLLHDFHEISYIAVPFPQNPMVDPPTELMFSPKFCEKNEDCLSIRKGCGDSDCPPRKVSCVNGLCCASSYTPGSSTDQLFASDNDFGHLASCADRIARYHVLDFCEIFSDTLESKCKNIVYNFVAFDENTSALCGNIVDDDTLRDDCYSMVATKTGNPELCTTVKSNVEKERCLSHIYTTRAYRTNDASLCLKVPILTSKDVYFSYAQDRCFSDIAAKTGDASVCSNAPLPVREGCIRSAAIRSMDYHYCISHNDGDCLWRITAENAAVDIEENCKKLLEADFNEQTCSEKLVALCNENLMADYSKRCVEKVSNCFQVYRDNVKPRQLIQQ